MAPFVGVDIKHRLFMCCTDNVPGDWNSYRMRVLASDHLRRFLWYGEF